MKLLMMCPTRGRPDRVLDMLRSFYATRSEGTKIILITSEDDPKYSTYEIVLYSEHHLCIKSRYLPDKQNYVVNLYPDVPYYGSVNDDHIFRTKGWDTQLIEAIEKQGNGWGLACGNDLMNANWFEHQHPSGCVISGNIVRALGYYDYPKFHSYRIDTWEQELFNGIKRLFFVPEVTIEHCHAHRNKAAVDENYVWGYSPEEVAYGDKVLEEWRRNEKIRDIAMLKKAMGEA
jgi:hypothetical protein